MKLGTALVLAVVALGAASSTTIIGCGGPGAKTAKVPKGEMPSGESWNGVYFHPIYGHLHLEEQDSSIRGKWKRTDQSAWGELSGTKSGNVLHYTWKEYKSGVVGPASRQQGKGYFVYVKTDDMEQAELRGEYGLGSDETGSEWKCVKQARQQPDLKSIGGDTGSHNPQTGGLD